MNVMLAVLLAAASTKVGGSAKITSDCSYYDYKEGIAYFSGSVSVEDNGCQLYANRAYVVTRGSNEIHRIVAAGNVVISNGTRCAYGAKATYYHQPGVIFLDSGGGRTAEIRDAASGGDQVVRGKRIKFWTNAKQVEVVEAELSAPAKDVFGGGIRNIRR